MEVLANPALYHLDQLQKKRRRQDVKLYTESPAASIISYNIVSLVCNSMHY